SNRNEGFCHVGLGYRVTWGVGVRGWYCLGGVRCTVEGCRGERGFGGKVG
nr:hypothetical protein [Tanacetum cinerariifolium]